MPVGGRAVSPKAFGEFCRSNRALCSTGSGPQLVELTAQRRHEMESVNRSVNARIRERPDASASRGRDRWEVPTTNGDCEDFAILKKKELMERGWPAGALLLTSLRAGEEGHAVLTVTTTAGDLILDNRRNAIKVWYKTPYHYYARQAAGNGSSWKRIGER